MVGASLARRAGLQVLGRVQREVEAGRVPAGPLVDGVIVLVAGALLITPGILTDAFGFLCLVPAFRSLVKRSLWRRFERAVREQRVHVTVDVQGFEPAHGDPLRDVGSGRGDRFDGGARGGGRDDGGLLH